MNKVKPARGRVLLCLTLAPGRTLAGLKKTRLLALHRARIAGEVTSCLKRLAEACVVLLERSCDAVADRFCLSGDTAASDLHGDFEVAFDAIEMESVLGDVHALAGLEVLVNRLAIDDDRGLR